jgi:hypothetical protein
MLIFYFTFQRCIKQVFVIPLTQIRKNIPSGTLLLVTNKGDLLNIDTIESGEKKLHTA